jgi:hypothetical protein
MRRDGDVLSAAAAPADEEPAAGLRGGVWRKEGEEGALVPLPIPPPPPPPPARGAGASGRRSSRKNRCDLSLPPRLPANHVHARNVSANGCSFLKEQGKRRRTKKNEGRQKNEEEGSEGNLAEEFWRHRARRRQKASSDVTRCVGRPLGHDQPRPMRAAV